MNILEFAINYLFNYNVAILTITTIFFSLSNLSVDVRKKIDEGIIALAKIKDMTVECKDEVNTSLNKKLAFFNKIIFEMGVLFRFGITFSIVSLVAILVFSFIQFSLPLHWYYYILILVLIYVPAVLLTTAFLLNVHNFKFIYHFDSSEYINLIIKRSEATDKRDFGELPYVMKELQNNENVKIGLGGIIKCFYPKKP